MKRTGGLQMQRMYFRLMGVGLAALVCGVYPALAQTAPPLGPSLPQFGVLGGAAVTGSTGAGTSVNGDVGSSPTPSVTTFPPSSTVSPFIVHSTNDAAVQQAHLDAIAAYNNMVAQGTGTPLGPQLNGQVLTAGLYSFTSSADLAATGTLTLNGPGVFIFSVNSTLTANVLSSVVGTANPCSVYWRIGTSATLNGNNFFGTVLADQSVTVASTNNLIGRAVGVNAAVTMPGGGGNTIGGCSAAAPLGGAAAVTAGAGGVYPDGTTFSGVPINGLQSGYEVEINGSSAIGQFTTVLLGVSNGLPVNIVIEGTATSGSRSATNIVTFSGTCTVNGAPGVPCTATITTNASDQGTIGLVIGATTLPNAVVSAGTMTIK
jgi:Ice-binding-like